MKQLILGGIRSGKSRYAEKAAKATGKPVTYIATAQNNDPDMQRRIATHQLRRPSDWQLIEEPITLSNALEQAASKDACILVDCLALWLNNLYYFQPDQSDNDAAAIIGQLCIEVVDNVSQFPGDIILVSNEIGLGIIPENKLAREYGDRLGELNQAVASVCDRVVFCVAGIPQIIK